MRYIILSIALFITATFSSLTASQALASTHAAKAAAVTSSDSDEPTPQQQYSKGRSAGYRDAQNSCQERDVSNRSDDFQRGYAAGFAAGYEEFC